MTRRRIPSFVLLGAALMASAVGVNPRHAAARDEGLSRVALLIDNRLTARQVSLVSIDDEEVEYLDSSGRRRRAVVESLVALLPSEVPIDETRGIGARTTIEGSEAQTTASGVVELIDGQRFPGEHVPTAASAAQDAIVWEHPTFGQIVLPLERIASLFRTGHPRPAADPDGEAPIDDEVILVNGDRIRGFIVALGDVIQIESEDRVIEVPSDRVAGAVFSNPRERPKGLLVWLDDGTVAALSSMISTGADGLSLELPNGNEGAYGIDEIRALSFHSGRITALSSLVPARQDPLGARLFAVPVRSVPHPDDGDGDARLGVRDLLLPGPMEVEFRLPPDAQRIAWTAELDEGTAPWGDCELVVLIDGREEWRSRLSTASPFAAMNLRANGDTLTIRLEEGRYGPVRDRVVLRRPIILLDAPDN